MPFLHLNENTEVEQLKMSQQNWEWKIERAMHNTPLR